MMQNTLPLNFILSFCQGIIPERGEDCYCYSFCDTAGFMGVFDGCGGAGARKHEFYSGKTEAYMASRLCAGAFYDGFRAAFPCDLPADKVASEILAPVAEQRLRAYAPPQEENGFGLKGSIVHTLPTTAAAALITQKQNDEILVSAIWAGDSRVFLLNAAGLAQLSVDDTSVPDPMENIYEDGVLKNMFCCDCPPNLHCRTIQIHPPFIALVATDGCFGYVSTPMEFEGMILDALSNANSPADWEQKLADIIGHITGDDYTLCLAAFGYSSFSALRQSYDARCRFMQERFLIPLQEIPVDDRQSRYGFWEQYRADYMRYL